ncbi:nucleoside deaminase [Pendulispora albinea]|uniref:tRNA-specific adenosine deaminase n=1 Tax=Pendulispora albinea TaxID=2741071 RepID=A0ABZ2LV14_9BACT
MDDAATPQTPEDRDIAWMEVALAEADAAHAKREVPIGCILVDAGGMEIARGHNLRETLLDATAHAEMVALRAAATKAPSWRLDGVTAYVTLEPCVMCAGAFVHARIARVVYGCDDPKGGALHSLYTVGQDTRLNHRFPITRGVLADACASRLRTFFAALRAQGKK